MIMTMTLTITSTISILITIRVTREGVSPTTGLFLPGRALTTGIGDAAHRCRCLGRPQFWSPGGAAGQRLLLARVLGGSLLVERLGRL